MREIRLSGLEGGGAVKLLSLPLSHPSTASLRPRKTKSSRFRIDRLDQSLDVAVAKRKSLEAVRIIRMTRHVVGTDRAGELRVAQRPHDGEEIHHPFVWINL